MKTYSFFLALVMSPTLVFGNFLIHPQRIILTSQKSSDSIQITNTDTVEKTYKMSFVEYMPQKDGGYRTLENRDGKLVYVSHSVHPKTKKVKETLTPLSETEVPFAKFSSPVVDFSPRKITLKPKETQLIRLMLNKKAPKEETVELRSHFLIEETNASLAAGTVSSTGGIKLDIQAQYSVTLPVIARFGDLKVEGSFKDIDVVSENNQAFVKVTLSRMGETRSLRGALVVLKKGGFFSSDVEMGRLNNIALYPNISERSFKIPLFKGQAPLSAELAKKMDLVVKFVGDTDDSPDISFEKEIKF